MEFMVIHITFIIENCFLCDNSYPFTHFATGDFSTEILLNGIEAGSDQTVKYISD